MTSFSKCRIRKELRNSPLLDQTVPTKKSRWKIYGLVGKIIMLEFDKVLVAGLICHK